jgi:hypothetical protein
VADKQQKSRAPSQPLLLHPSLGLPKPTKLREEAINSDDGDRIVRMIQEALGIEPDEVAISF